MTRAALRALLTLVTLATPGQASAALPPTPTPVTSPVADTLPDLIRAARQVIVYAPDLSRPDIAEAVRLAVTQRGVNVYLITSEAPLYLDDSLTLRLALMRVPTYLASGSGVPFMLIDGRAVSGPGVTGPGAAAWLSDPQSAQLAGWVRTVTRQKPVDVVAVMREWVRRHGGPTLR